MGYHGCKTHPNCRSLCCLHELFTSHSAARLAQIPWTSLEAFPSFKTRTNLPPCCCHQCCHRLDYNSPDFHSLRQHTHMRDKVSKQRGSTAVRKGVQHTALTNVIGARISEPPIAAIHIVGGHWDALRQGSSSPCACAAPQGQQCLR